MGGEGHPPFCLVGTRFSSSLSSRDSARLMRASAASRVQGGSFISPVCFGCGYSTFVFQAILVAGVSDVEDGALKFCWLAFLSFLVGIIMFVGWCSLVCWLEILCLLVDALMFVGWRP